MGRKKYPKSEKKQINTCVIYTRVSTEEQEDNFSLSAQIDICTEYATSKGWKVIRAYQDVGSGGSVEHREEFQAMLEAAKRQEFDVIICHKLDRFSRDVLDTLKTIQELEEMNISFVSVREQYDFTTPMGKIFLTMLAGFAEHYLNNLRDEVMKGQRKRAQSGLWSSRMPFGYSSNEKGEAVADENAEGVKLAFAMSAEGYSLREIAEKMNSKGYKPTGRAGSRSLEKWSKDSVAYMTKNRFYLGEVFYRGKWYEGVHEALITKDEYKRANESLKARRGRGGHQGKKRSYPLTGLIRCGQCGAPMRGTYRKSDKKEYKYYRCSNPLKSEECDMPYIPANEMEEKFCDNIKAIKKIIVFKDKTTKIERE